MSMRGKIISEEYKKMVWISDENGKQYACYADDLKGKIKPKKDMTEEEKEKCLDLSLVLGDSW